MGREGGSQQQDSHEQDCGTGTRVKRWLETTSRASAQPGAGSRFVFGKGLSNILRLFQFGTCLACRQKARNPAGNGSVRGSDSALRTQRGDVYTEKRFDQLVPVLQRAGVTKLVETERHSLDEHPELAPRYATIPSESPLGCTVTHCGSRPRRLAILTVTKPMRGASNYLCRMLTFPDDVTRGSGSVSWRLALQPPPP